MNAFKVWMLLLATLLAPTAHAANGSSETALWLAGVDLDQAARMIRGSRDARILSARTTVVDGRETHVFKVLTRDGRIQHIKVDAQSGRVFGRKRH